MSSLSSSDTYSYRVVVGSAGPEALDGMKVDTSSLKWIASSSPLCAARSCWLQADG